MYPLEKDTLLKFHGHAHNFDQMSDPEWDRHGTRPIVQELVKEAVEAGRAALYRSLDGLHVLFVDPGLAAPVDPLLLAYTPERGLFISEQPSIKAIDMLTRRFYSFPVRVSLFSWYDTLPSGDIVTRVNAYRAALPTGWQDTARGFVDRFNTIMNEGAVPDRETFMSLWNDMQTFSASLPVMPYGKELAAQVSTEALITD